MNPAAQHLTSCLSHLALAQTSAALACAELAGKPRTQQATDALNDILESIRSVRTLREALTVSVPSPGGDRHAEPGQQPNLDPADPPAAAPVFGAGGLCAACGEAVEEDAELCAACEHRGVM